MKYCIFISAFVVTAPGPGDVDAPAPIDVKAPSPGNADDPAPYGKECININHMICHS